MASLRFSGGGYGRYLARLYRSHRMHRRRHNRSWRRVRRHARCLFSGMGLQALLNDVLRFNANVSVNLECIIRLLFFFLNGANACF